MKSPSLPKLRLAAACLAWCGAPLLGIAQEKAAPPPKPPDRRELWVPADQLAEILARNPKAVLLSREQYEALLRDARPNPITKTEPPRAAALVSANYAGQVDGRVLRVHAEFSARVLSEHWAQIPLPLGGVSLGAVQIDGDAALVTPQPQPVATKGKPATKPEPSPTPSFLLIHGAGEHRITAEFTVPLTSNAGYHSVTLQLPRAGGGAFQIDLPPHTHAEASQPLRIETLPEVTRLTAVIAPSAPALALAWHTTADPANSLPAQAEENILHRINADNVRTECSFTLSTSLGALPAQFQIAVPPDATILEVAGAEIANWSAEAGVVKVALQPGERSATVFRLVLQQPSLAAAPQATRELPIPKINGITRISGQLSIHADASVEVKEIVVDPAARPVTGDLDSVATWRFADATPAAHVTFNRLQPRFSADLDTLVEFKLDAVYLERTITLHEEKGELFHLEVTVPAGEEVLAVRSGDLEPDWRLEAGQVRVRWSDVAPPGQPRSFVVRSRIEPANWTQPAPAGISFALADAKIEGAVNVSGYIALRADESFRLEAQPSETLEQRDGRTTPVHGDYAWFRRDRFALQVKVAKRPGEVLAALTGYALPMEGVLDLHARIAWEFQHSGVRSVRIRVPEAVASQFHFEGPQIAERNLAGDLWTITFQKELTGAYGMDVTAQTAITHPRDDPSKFNVEVPAIEPVGVQRASGVWAIEANTETEIQITSKGMNELDALAAPTLPGYQPKHRVIGVFGWIGGTYTLSLSGVRHAPAQVLTTVVDEMAVESVLSTSGAARTQATLKLRTAGAQFLDLALPKDARLLSLSVDENPRKPVEGAANQVRVQLPAKGDSAASTTVVILFETKTAEWGGRGELEVLSPRLPRDVPVLRSTWHVYLPDGFRYSDFSSNLRAPTPLPDRLLILEPLGWCSQLRCIFAPARAGFAPLRIIDAAVPQSAMEAPPAAAVPAKIWAAQPGIVAALGDVSPDERTRIEAKLQQIILPKFECREKPLRDVLEELKSYARAADRTEADPTRRGFMIADPMRVLPSEAGASAITISLANIPLGELLKYVTSLAGVKYKIVAGGIAIAPLSVPTESLITKEMKVQPGLFETAVTGAAAESNQGLPATRQDAKKFLEAQGINFPPGASAVYLPQSGKLIVKNTTDNLELLELVAGAGAEPSQSFINGGKAGVAGLLPIKLDLPKIGNQVTFEGLTAPDHVTFHYDDWWSRARRLWWALVLGGLAFFLVGQGRPWWNALWVVLILTAIPVCFSPASTAVCNALLAGWLLALILNRLTARLAPATRREEALAS